MINGDSIIKALSSSKDGIVATSYADDAVVDKKAYSIRQSFDLATNEVKQIVFDPSLYGEDVFLEPFKVSTSNGQIVLRLLPGVDITTGSNELPVFNRYGLVDDPVHKMGCFDTFTGLDRGSQEPLVYNVGTPSTFLNAGGGVVAGSRIFTFKKELKYLLEFDNTIDTGATTVSLQFDWFEL